MSDISIVEKLFSLCEKGDLAELKKLFDNTNADVNARNEKGESLIQHAVNFGKMNIVKYLLSIGINIESKDNKGLTLLHVSCSNGYEELSKLLIHKGIGANSLSEEGNTPLHLAVINGHKRVVKMLLDNGANILIKNKVGLMAEEFGDEKIKQVLTKWKNQLRKREYEKLRKYAKQLKVDNMKLETELNELKKNVLDFESFEELQKENTQLKNELEEMKEKMTTLVGQDQWKILTHKFIDSISKKNFNYDKHFSDVSTFKARINSLFHQDTQIRPFARDIMNTQSESDFFANMKELEEFGAKIITNLNNYFGQLFDEDIDKLFELCIKFYQEKNQKKASVETEINNVKKIISGVDRFKLLNEHEYEEKYVKILKDIQHQKQVKRNLINSVINDDDTNESKKISKIIKENNKVIINLKAQLEKLERGIENISCFEVYKRRLRRSFELNKKQFLEDYELVKSKKEEVSKMEEEINSMIEKKKELEKNNEDFIEEEKKKIEEERKNLIEKYRSEAEKYGNKLKEQFLLKIEEFKEKEKELEEELAEKENLNEDCMRRIEKLERELTELKKKPAKVIHVPTPKTRPPPSDSFKKNKSEEKSVVKKVQPKKRAEPKKIETKKETKKVEKKKVEHKKKEEKVQKKQERKESQPAKRNAGGVPIPKMNRKDEQPKVGSVKKLISGWGRKKESPEKLEKKVEEPKEVHVEENLEPEEEIIEESPEEKEESEEELDDEEKRKMRSRANIYKRVLPIGPGDLQQNKIFKKKTEKKKKKSQKKEEKEEKVEKVKEIEKPKKVKSKTPKTNEKKEKKKKEEKPKKKISAMQRRMAIFENFASSSGKDAPFQRTEKNEPEAVIKKVVKEKKKTPKPKSEAKPPKKTKVKPKPKQVKKTKQKPKKKEKNDDSDFEVMDLQAIEEEIENLDKIIHGDEEEDAEEEEEEEDEENEDEEEEEEENEEEDNGKKAQVSYEKQMKVSDIIARYGNISKKKKKKEETEESEDDEEEEEEEKVYTNPLHRKYVTADSEERQVHERLTIKKDIGKRTNRRKRKNINISAELNKVVEE